MPLAMCHFSSLTASYMDITVLSLLHSIISSFNLGHYASPVSTMNSFLDHRSAEPIVPPLDSPAFSFLSLWHHHPVLLHSLNLHLSMKMLAHLISIHIGQKWDIFSALGRSAYTAVWASEFQRFMYLRETIHPHLTFNAWSLTLNLWFKVRLVASSPLIPLRIWCLKEITTQVLIQETFIIKSPKILYFFRDPKPPQNLVV